MPNQRRPDTAPLNLRPHTHRAQHLHLDQPPSRIQQTAAEHHMPHHPAVLLSDQRKTTGLPQGASQLSNNTAMIAERLQVNLPHSLVITRKFLSKLHPHSLQEPAAHRVQTAA
ncbi:hypothetical protein GCM10009554_18700 [Kribbella koreensis]|uniref:Uncharacterized protein n=1 Tax=Kribbella koreensis TaxID=57909 RepID=A0ABN1PUH8_9ACTN